MGLIKKSSVFILIICLLFIVSCNSLEQKKLAAEKLVCVPADSVFSEATGNAVKEQPEEVVPETEEKQEEVKEEPKEEVQQLPPVIISGGENATQESLTKEYTEGELIKLKIKAVDADKDNLTFTFSTPLNENGEWQTKAGDAGTHETIVTVSDGKSTVSKKVILVIKKLNMAPTIEIQNSFKVAEGETVALNPKVTDPENENVTITYSGWMTSNTKATTYDDAGTYLVSIKASDGVNEASKNIKVIVENKNRAVVMEPINDISVKEGALVEVKPAANDPDNDKLTFTFNAPLDKDGKWQTKEGDKGEYPSSATVSDSLTQDTKSFKIIVTAGNNPPAITQINDIVVQVGQTITLNPIVNDLENDNVTITYSGWMSTNTKTTSESDSGKHSVTITASDGKKESSITVSIDVNTPPEFVFE